MIVLWWDWWNEPAARERQVPLPANSSVLVTEAITGSGGTRRRWRIELEGGRVTITLGRVPLFVQLAMPADCPHGERDGR